VHITRPTLLILVSLSVYASSTEPACGAGVASSAPATASAPTGQGVPPIARWDTVPFQRLVPGRPLNVGVVAFSKFGVRTVRFSIRGQGYTGGHTDVSAMSRNEQSGVCEYWTPVAAEGFTSDGPVTLEATVYGGDGGTRQLPALPLVVNPKGTLPRPEVWVDATAGNDDTGEVGVSAKPFRTIGAAMRGISTWMGARGNGPPRLDGGVIRLRPGTHAADSANIWSEMPTVNEWVTITTAEGGTRENTILRPGSGCFLTSKLALRGITVDRSGGGGPVIDSTSAYGPNEAVWCDGCRMIGAGRWGKNTYPLSGNIGRVYLTECAITECDYPTLNSNSTLLARGLDIKHIGNDAFQNVPMVVNCTVDDIDPGDTGEHADCIGDWTVNGERCRIVYGLRATNLHYQGIWNNQDSRYATPLEGYAFVNVYLQLADPIRRGGGGSAYAFGTDHLLLWNCTFDSSTHDPCGHGFGLYVDGRPRQRTRMDNVSVVGCAFGFVTIQIGPLLSVDMSHWDANHYCRGAMQPGTNKTSGPPMLNATGRPLPDSPLLKRVKPLVVPFDAAFMPRPTPGTVGAFEP
jgi:hypothetical protein